ncbi:hypothetical protein T09_1915 [Trichinella sp. T9]|nr:hypothetical protein T09_1915 [Trichinella sp. T9]
MKRKLELMRYSTPLFFSKKCSLFNSAASELIISA